MANVSTTPAAQNFDLAQATKRYEEAQREIRRLGSIIQAQESKHVAEKREIEGMLFDPAIASSAQVALKESYEQRINALEGQLKSKGIEPLPVASADIQATAKMIEPSSGRDLSRPVMATGYGVMKSSEPPPPPSMIPPISEVEVMRDMMPLPVPTMAMAPAIQQVPVERIIERVVEKSDPQKDAQIAQISKELQALKKNQEQQTLENAQLRSELLQKQKAKEEANLNIIQASRMAEESKQNAAEAQAKIKEQANIESIPLPTPVTPPIARPNFMAESEISSLLKRAGVPLSNSVSDMGDGNDTYKAFRWKSGELFGSSEQRIVNSSSDYQSAIAAYMDRARARCKGDFAAEPTGLSASVSNGQGYEIACVGETINSTASVMFSYGDRIMTTIAHEGKAEVMGDAMNARDKVANVFSSMITALR
jgi:cell division septum initiation protein DivIVA